MKNKLRELEDKLLLRNRGVVESTIDIDILKEQLNREHSRHRRMWGFFVPIFSSFISYQMTGKNLTYAKNWQLSS